MAPAPGRSTRFASERAALRESSVTPQVHVTLIEIGVSPFQHGATATHFETFQRVGTRLRPAEHGGDPRAP
jgi:hypothetical protein